MRWGISRGVGGLPGLDVHLGAWQAIEEVLGPSPATVTGASAGAIVSALQAGGMSSATALQTLLSLRREDIIQYRRLWQTRVFWLDSILQSSPIRRLLTDLLPVKFADCEIELLVSTTMMTESGFIPILWRQGPLAPVVQASAAIPGIWPYVTLGRFYPHADGGLADGVVTPNDIGAYDVWVHVEPTRRTCYRQRDKNVVSRLLGCFEALSSYTVAQERATLERLLGDRLIWIEADLGTASMLHFDHSLVDAARDAAWGTLKARGLC